MDKISKTDEQWQSILTPEQFKVCRKKGTEQAFSGAYYDSKETGVYHCICCNEALFSSEDKFDSGTGWPSFRAPIDPSAVASKEDKTLFIKRTEVLCARCDAHLGHVFPDGPAPAGLRYCINSVALNLSAE